MLKLGKDRIEGSVGITLGFWRNKECVGSSRGLQQVVRRRDTRDEPRL